MSHTNQPLRNQNENQTTDPLDAVLLAEFNSAEQLRPSSGFALSVMDAIREEAAVPPPIPFPWKHVLPGAIAVLCALVAMIVWAVLHTGPVATYNFGAPDLASINAPFYWIALALVLTLIAVSSSFRLANRRSR